MPAFPRAACVLAVILLLSAATAAGPKKADSQKPPKGFIEMTVVGVVETNGGRAVVLKESEEGYRLPIWIGDAEAFAIDLRLNRRRFQRPLTHDLLDTIMQKLGGQLVKIQVDDLKTNTFVGTVFIKHKGKEIAIDARPSDSIALALGNRVPIYVSLDVLKRAGFLEKDQNQKKPESSDPEKLLKDILKSGKEEHTL